MLDDGQILAQLADHNGIFALSRIPSRGPRYNS